MKKIILLITGILLFSNICEANFILNIKNKENKVINNTIDTQFKGHTISIRNGSNNEVTASIHAADSIYTSSNRLYPNPNYKDSLFIGKWIKFKEDTLVFEPGETKVLQYNINVPANSTPGNYQGQIVISAIQGGDSSAPLPTNSVSIAVIDFASLSVNVPGTIQNKYELESFEMTKESNLVPLFTTKVKNSGNGVLSFDGEISIQNQANQKTVKSININSQSILQGGHKEFKATWPEAPNKGDFKATIKLNIYNLDVSTNKIEKLETLNKTIDFTLTPPEAPTPIQNLAKSTLDYIPLLLLLFLVALTLIILIILKNIINKQYLKNCENYEVQDKETLESIAAKFSMKWQKLAKINKCKPPYSLIAGQKLLVHSNNKPPQS